MKKHIPILLLAILAAFLLSWQPVTETKSYLVHNSGKVFEFLDFTVYEEDIEIVTPSKRVYCFEWAVIDTIVYRQEPIKRI